MVYAKIVDALEASKGSNFLTTPALRMAELPICLDQVGTNSRSTNQSSYREMGFFDKVVVIMNISLIGYRFSHHHSNLYAFSRVGEIQAS
jgi:hypothetical protein